MTDHERAALRDWVQSFKPNLVLEVGTWKGGGSTWQIANALKSNGSGHLITCEVDPKLYTEASRIYDSIEWREYVTCLIQPSTDVIQSLIRKRQIPDFILFDGPDDKQLTISDFQLLDEELESGTLFACHDWDRVEHNDGARIFITEKCDLLRPHLEKNPNWKILHQLTHPVSVGLILAQKQ